MPSLRHHLLVGFLRLTRRKRIYASVRGLHAGIAQTRHAGPARPGAAVARRTAIGHAVIDGVEVYTLTPRAARRGGPQSGARQVLYLHGGAYVRPITRWHWAWLAELVERAGVAVTVPLYPLAPESTCAHTVAAVQRVYERLRGQGGAPITVMGDSAGGGLAVALTLALRDAGHALPEHLVLITPALDARLDDPQIAATAPLDPMLAVPGAREAGRLYAGAWPLDHPYVSPLRADPRGLPPITLLVAPHDILCHDALRFAQQARAEGVSVRLHQVSSMIHVWPLLPTPEGRAARRWLAEVIGQGVPPPLTPP